MKLYYYDADRHALSRISKEYAINYSFCFLQGPTKKEVMKHIKPIDSQTCTENTFLLEIGSEIKSKVQFGDPWITVKPVLNMEIIELGVPLRSKYLKIKIAENIFLYSYIHWLYDLCFHLKIID